MNAPRTTSAAAAARTRRGPGIRLAFGFTITGCFLALALSRAPAPAASDPLTRFSYTEYHMGVDARLVVYAPDRSRAEDACAAAFARIAALDSIMSDYRVNSELNRLCTH